MGRLCKTAKRTDVLVEAKSGDSCPHGNPRYRPIVLDGWEGKAREAFDAALSNLLWPVVISSSQFDFKIVHSVTAHNVRSYKLCYIGPDALMSNIICHEE